MTSSTTTDQRDLHRRIGIAALNRKYISLDQFAEAMMIAGATLEASPADIWLASGVLDRTELAELLHVVHAMASRPVPSTIPTARVAERTPDDHPVLGVLSGHEEDPTLSFTLADVLKTHGFKQPLQLDDAYREHDTGDVPSALPEPRSGEIEAATVSGSSFTESDRYIVGSELGRGGVGRVVKVFDRYLGRTVAMKLPLYWPTVPEEVDKFIEEAQATGQLEHPNIVPVYDIGTLPSGEVYYTMKRVRNHTLRNVIDGLSRNDPEIVEEYGNTRLLSIFLQVCQAIHYAHVRGVIHRDLKPDNIMLGDYGEVHVMDWGLARIMDRSVVTDRSLAGSERLEDGQTIGTPAYMPPEQAQGKLDRVDERSDVYSLGVVLYEMVTLRQPSTRATVMETLLAVISEPITPPSKAAPKRSVSPELDRIIMRALEKDAFKRWASAKDLHDAVEKFLDGRSEREAERHLLEGEGLVRSYEQAKSEVARLEKRVAEARVRIRDWESVEVKRNLWALEDRLRETANRMIRVFGEAIRELTRTLAFTPDSAAARTALARLYWSRYELAEQEENERDKIYYLSLLRQFDDGTWLPRIHNNAPVSIYTEPTPAHVFLYTYEEVDRVLSLRDAQYLGKAPVAEFFTRRGSYKAVIKLAGYPLIHYPIHVQRPDPLGVIVPIPPRELLRTSFCFIPGGISIVGGDPEAVDPLPLGRVEVPSFFMQRFPVTFAEYLEFLDDLDRTSPGEADLRAPRTRDADGYLAQRESDGRWRPSRVLIEGPLRAIWPEDEGHEDRVPVMAIRFEDAEAYARWLTAREDGRVIYRLPTEHEWERASRGADGRVFPWGNYFDATFCKMAFSRDSPSQPEPVGTFTYDRSPFDVHDLAGGVRCWVYSEDNDALQSVVRGGYWAGDARSCRAASRRRVMKDSRLANLGFRLCYSVPAAH